MACPLPRPFPCPLPPPPPPPGTLTWLGWRVSTWLSRRPVLKLKEFFGPKLSPNKAKDGHDRRSHQHATRPEGQAQIDIFICPLLTLCTLLEIYLQ